MNEPVKSPFDRRDFLKVAAGGVGALMASSAKAQTQTAESLAAKPAVDVSATGPASLPPVRPGSDFMIDVIKSAGLRVRERQSGREFPRPYGIGGQLRREQESAADHCAARGSQPSPWLTDTSRSKASRWAFSCTAPSACSTQSWPFTAPGATASRWCMFVGNDIDMADRSSRVDMVHSAQDVGALVRSMTKWDDAPVSLNGFAEAAMRGYKIAMTPPYGPVVIAIDKYLQERPDSRRLEAGHPEIFPHLGRRRPTTAHLPKPPRCW